VQTVAVYTTVVLTVLLAIGLIAITGIRWAMQQTPSSIVVVQTTPEAAGATIVVTREGGSPRPPVTVEDPTGRTPLFLERGAYIIRVEKAGKVLYRTERPMYVAEGRRYDIDIASGITSPSTRP
jgi:hypothetical protein